jgi:thioredoxin-related protein
MKRIVTQLAFLLALTAAAPVPADEAPIAWRSWDSGMEEARKRGLPILLDVYTDWCGWCKRMDRDVYSRPEVRDYVRRSFVPVKLNAEASRPAEYEGQAYTSRSLAAALGVTGFPTTVFFRANGEYVTRVPGYVPADRFLAVLRYIGEGHLDRGVTFQKFLNEASKAR